MVDQIATSARGNIGAATIKVVGVGGGGSNAVTRMFRDPIPGVEYITVNTDSQALARSDVPVRIRVGDRTARGLGVGGDPSKGRECHEEDRDEIKRSLEGADLVFIAAGMGGGTGTGGSPVVAEIAQESDALTVGVVTKPFNFEGMRRKKQAEEGIKVLADVVDTLIVIPNDRLLIMSNAGPAWMAIGHGSGEDRAIMAAEAAVDSPLLEVSIEGARGVIFNVTGGTDLTLQEVQQASEVVSNMVDPDCNIIFGMVTDHKMENEVKMTIIATGFPSAEASAEQEAAAATALGEIMSDDEAIDLPPFLRHHRSARRRTTHETSGND